MDATKEAGKIIQEELNKYNAYEFQMQYQSEIEMLGRAFSDRKNIDKIYWKTVKHRLIEELRRHG